MGSKGVIGLGSYNVGSTRDFWEYEPAAHTWMQGADFTAGSIGATVGFSIANRGYVGTGIDSPLDYQGFWEYSAVTGVSIISGNIGKLVAYPNPATTNFTVSASFENIELYNAVGEQLKLQPDQSNLSYDVSEMAPGVYFIKAYFNGTSLVKKLIKL